MEVMSGHIEFAKCTFNMLAVLTKDCNVLFSPTSSLRILFFFPFYYQNLLTKNPYRLYYFILMIILVNFANVLYRIARFVRMKRGEGVDFD